jgi:hypothetical protein
MSGGLDNFGHITKDGFIPGTKLSGSYLKLFRHQPSSPYGASPSRTCIGRVIAFSDK